MPFSRRSLRTALVIAVVLAALLLAVAMCVSAENRNADGQDPYAYLEMLDESDLKKMLFDKMRGQVQLDTFRRKADLVAAVRQLEEQEDRAAHFNAQVAAALARKAEAERLQQEQQQQQAARDAVPDAAASAKKRHRSAAPSTGAVDNSNKNKNDNNKQKVVQLIDDEEGAEDTVKVQVRPAAVRESGEQTRHRIATAGRAGRAAAKHKLEVLFCTG